MLDLGVAYRAVFVSVMSQGAISGILNKRELAPVLFLLGATCATVSLCDRYRSLRDEPRMSRKAAPCMPRDTVDVLTRDRNDHPRK